MNEETDSTEDYRQAIRRALPLARTADERFDLYMALGDLLLSADPDRALDAFSAAEGQVPGSAEATAALAECHLACWRLDEAEAAARSAISSDPQEPRAHYVLALLSERGQDSSAALRHYRLATAADPDLYQVPLDVDEDSFLELVRECLAALPKETSHFLDQVAVACEDLPSRNPEQCPSPMAFSLFEEDESHLILPRQLVLYRKNLVRGAESLNALRALIATIIEEQVVHILRIETLPPPQRAG